MHKECIDAIQYLGDIVLRQSCDVDYVRDIAVSRLCGLTILHKQGRIHRLMASDLEIELDYIDAQGAVNDNPVSLKGNTETPALCCGVRFLKGKPSRLFAWQKRLGQFHDVLGDAERFA